ncbi:uncharacterized protein [Diadema antillarum]|uniref:uncharacterized protein n=1 Tax=Diadema antillarum TaxID=105358 RepID=UPI003A87C21C
MSESGVDLDFDLQMQADEDADQSESVLMKDEPDELDRILASFDCQNIYEIKSQSAESSLRMGTEFSPGAMSMRTTLRQELMRQQVHQEKEKEDQLLTSITPTTVAAAATGAGVSSSSSDTGSFMHMLQGGNNPLLSASAPGAVEIPQPNKLSPVPELSSLPREVLKV